MSKGQEIVFVRVADLLERRDLITPDAGLLMPELPVTQPRPVDARPSVEELIASDRTAQGLALAAEEPADYGSN